MNDKVRLYLQIAAFVVVLGGVLSTSISFFINSKISELILNSKLTKNTLITLHEKDKQIMRVVNKNAIDIAKLQNALMSLNVLVNTKFEDTATVTRNQQNDLDYLLHK